MSETRDRILQAIKDHWTEKGYPPAVRDLCEAVGVTSTSTVQAHICALQNQGKIVREPGIPRSIRVVEK